MRSTKSVLWIALLLAATGTTFCLGTPRAEAHGFGVHVAGGAGDGAHWQGGLSWDTAVASERLLNYRMNLGYEAFELDREHGKENLSGVILENTLGFRLHGSEGARVWAGPEIAVGVYDHGLAGAGVGLSLGANLHVTDRTSIGLAAGVRAMSYSGMFGGDDRETVGFMRVELFLRTPRDRFRGSP